MKYDLKKNFKNLFQKLFTNVIYHEYMMKDYCNY